MKLRNAYMKSQAKVKEINCENSLFDCVMKGTNMIFIGNTTHIGRNIMAKKI